MIALALALLTAAPAPGFAEGLAWPFDSEATMEGSRTLYRFRSRKPVSGSGRGKTFLRFSVAITDCGDAAAAASAFEALKKKADPNTGLSYAWDTVYLDGARLVHLAAPCLFSRANVARLEANVEASLGEPHGRVLRCSCGGGCAERSR